MWSLSSGEQLQCFTGHTRRVSCVSFFPSDPRNRNRSARHSRVVSHFARMSRLRSHFPTALLRLLLLFSQYTEEHVVVSGSWDKTIRIWSVSSGTCLRTMMTDKSTDVIYVSTDWSTLASGAYDAITFFSH